MFGLTRQACAMRGVNLRGLNLRGVSLRGPSLQGLQMKPLINPIGIRMRSVITDSPYWRSVIQAVKDDDYVNNTKEGIRKHKVPSLPEPDPSHLPDSNVSTVRAYRHLRPNTLKILNAIDKVTYGGCIVMEQSVFLNNCLVLSELHNNLHKVHLAGLDRTYNIKVNSYSHKHIGYIAPLLRQLSLLVSGAILHGYDIEDLTLSEKMNLFHRYEFTESTMVFREPTYYSYTHNNHTYYSNNIHDIVEFIILNQEAQKFFGK